MIKLARSPLQVSGFCILILGIASILTGLDDGAAMAQRRSSSAKPFKRVPFKPACANPSYPTPAPAKNPPIDSQCGLNGSGTAAEGAQDAAKNNFCAKGTPEEITIPQLIDLQQKVESNPKINFGNANSAKRTKGPTTDRAPLRTLGEGKLVTLKAYVLIARQEGPESVNCGKNVGSTSDFHDIHISFVADAPATPGAATVDAGVECAGVVGEMSPHHRPDSWNHANVEKVARAGLPVRVTGHLFFDSSHFPCTNGQPSPGNPKRISLWEVHPIYKFEVCTSDCDSAGTWLSLDEWVKQR